MNDYTSLEALNERFPVGSKVRAYGETYTVIPASQRTAGPTVGSAYGGGNRGQGYVAVRRDRDGQTNGLGKSLLTLLCRPGCEPVKAAPSIAGPLEPNGHFKGTREVERKGSSTAIVSAAIEAGAITKTGTYAVLCGGEVALIEVERPEPVEPPLRVKS